MTPRELHQNVSAMWPSLPTAKAPWAEQYISVLSAYSGDEIDKAWQSWHRSPDHDFAPKPYEIQRRIIADRPVYLGQPEATAEVSQTYPMTDDEVHRLQKTLADLDRQPDTSANRRFVRMGQSFLNKHYAAGGQ